MNLGESIKTARVRMGLTIPEAAKRSGMNRSYWYQIERGMRHPGTDKIVRMAEGLGVPVSQLAGGPEATPLTPIQKRLLGLLEQVPQRRVADLFAYAGRLAASDMETSDPHDAMRPAV